MEMSGQPVYNNMNSLGLASPEMLIKINGGVARDRVLEDAQLGGWDSEQGEAEETTGLERFLGSVPLEGKTVDELKVALEAVDAMNPNTRRKVEKIKKKLVDLIDSRNTSALRLSNELQSETARRGRANDNIKRYEIDEKTRQLAQQLADEKRAIESLGACLSPCNELLDRTGFEEFLRPDADFNNSVLVEALAKALRNETEKLKQGEGGMSEITRRHVMQIKELLPRKMLLNRIIFDQLKLCESLCDYLLKQGAGGGMGPM